MRTVKFPYKDLNDPKYIKDKKQLLKEHGNGWWIFVGNPTRKKRRYL